MSKVNIRNRLNSLEDIDGVTVTISHEGDTVHINQKYQHSLDFEFHWKENPGRFLGYFVDNNGRTSQAVIALKKPMDAIRFATAYSLLVEMRARKRTAR
jgi:hypothetical protein